MKIVSHRRIVEFYQRHPQSKTALEQWYHQTKNATWKCYADITKDFNSTDGIGDQRYVFNIKGNDYRLVVVEITEQLYLAALARIEELLPLVNDETPQNDRSVVELTLMSDIIIEFESTNFPIAIPSLADTMRLKIEEQKISRKSLSEKLGVSPSRISEYLSGKSEPTLKIARAISRELNISPAIILGV